MKLYIKLAYLHGRLQKHTLRFHDWPSTKRFIFSAMVCYKIITFFY